MPPTANPRIRTAPVSHRRDDCLMSYARGVYPRPPSTGPNETLFWMWRLMRVADDIVGRLCVKAEQEVSAPAEVGQGARPFSRDAKRSALASRSASRRG
jgi:hypothetical protein